MFSSKNLFFTRKTASTAYTISRSLRFRRSAVGNLTRTFGTPTTQNTFSFSCWTKRGLLSTLQIFFGYSNLNSVYFTAADNIALTNGTTTLTSTAVYRDPSAWYHILYTQSGTTANIYVNGTLAVTGTCSVSFNTASVAHCIGSYSPASASYDGYIAEVYFVDGQVKAVSDFTATDATTGVIGPKAYTGTYGNNGFYLPFTLNNTSTYAASFNGSSQALSVTTPATSLINWYSSNFTLEYWINPTSFIQGANGESLVIGNMQPSGSSTFWSFGTITGGTVRFYWYSGAVNTLTTTQTIPTGQWTHLAFVKNGTTLTIYINGISAATTTLSNSPQSGSAQPLSIAASSAGFFTGSLSNIRIVNGTAVYTSNFTPPSSPLTAITNTSFLTLQSATIVDNSSNAYTITNTGAVATSTATPFVANITSDASGQNNGWTSNNINYTSSGTTYDSMIDSPTNYADGGNGRGNYAVLNPLDKYSTNTVSDGNLATNGLGLIRSTFGMTSGKWYWEFIPQSTLCICGIAKSNAALATYLGGDANGWSYYANGNKYNSGPVGAYGATYTTNDIIGVAFDADNGTLTFYKNGTSQGVAFTGLTSGPYFAATSDNAATAQAGVFNFGQQPFRGLYVSGSGSSYVGTGAPPSGFSALNTQNLPTPTIAAGNAHFDALIYTGSGSTTRSITGLSFAPDLIWHKSRSAADDHRSVDIVRAGSTSLSSKMLFPNLTLAEDTTATGYITQTSSGYDLGVSASPLNVNGRTYVSWNWKAAGVVSANNNTSGSITSTVSANVSAGFSVVTGVSTGTSGSISVGHGLNVTPSMVIFKNRDLADNWYTWHTSLGASTSGYNLKLNLPDAIATNANIWGGAGYGMTSTTIGLGQGNLFSASNQKFVCYCFAPVAGYSAFGSYTGNGSADGPFVYCGFRPKFLLLKRADAAASNWRIHDSSRNTYNLVNTSSYPNLSNAEYTPDSINEDFLSNGFKLRSADGESNASGGTYIYAAFAENPFKYSRAR